MKAINFSWHFRTRRKQIMPAPHVDKTKEYSEKEIHKCLQSIFDKTKRRGVGVEKQMNEKRVRKRRSIGTYIQT